MSLVEVGGKFIYKHRETLISVGTQVVSTTVLAMVNAGLEIALNTKDSKKYFVSAEEEINGGKIIECEPVTYTAAIKNRIHPGNAERYEQSREELHDELHGDDCNCHHDKKKKKKK